MAIIRIIFTSLLEIYSLLLTSMLVNLFMIVGIYLSIGLGLSLAGVLTVFVTDIVCVVLLSALILRIVELLVTSLTMFRLSLLFCMPVSIVVLLGCSILLETISIGFRSISLGFRVFANVSAGHVLADILNAVRYLTVAGLTSFLLQATYTYAIFVYEFLVSCVQLGVFISLVSVYVE